MATLEQDIEHYHAWMRLRCKVDVAGLMAKRERMGDSAFAFLRATFFRWATTCEPLFSRGPLPDTG